MPVSSYSSPPPHHRLLSVQRFHPSQHIFPTLLYKSRCNHGPVQDTLILCTFPFPVPAPSFQDPSLRSPPPGYCLVSNALHPACSISLRGRLFHCFWRPHPMLLLRSGAPAAGRYSRPGIPLLGSCNAQSPSRSLRCRVQSCKALIRLGLAAAPCVRPSTGQALVDAGLPFGLTPPALL